MFWPNSTKIATILADVQAILAIVKRPKPTRIALEIPRRRSKKGVVMPNFEIPNDEIITVSVKSTDTSGAVEPFPGGDIISVASSDVASLQAVVGVDASNNPAIILTPLVQKASNLTITVSDSAGLTQVVQIVDIVADVAPKNLVLDLADATHTSQPVPTTPGPG
jgi:hypothetical protein